MSTSLFLTSFASVESEAQEDIQAGCREGQILVHRFTPKDYVCVDPTTANRWKELGLAEIIQIPDVKNSVSDSKPDLIPSVTNFDSDTHPTPSKKSIPISDNSECREGYVLIYRFVHHDIFCITTSTASTWELLGLAEIIKSTQFDESFGINHDDSLKESNSNINTEEETQNTEEETQNTEEETQNTEEETQNTEEETQNTEEETQNTEFTSLETSNLSTKNVYQIQDRIWVAVGYGVTNSVLIEGDTGIIVIDPLNSYDLSKQVLDDYRKYTDKPITAIIFTKIDPDSISGSKPFLEDGNHIKTIINEEILDDFVNDYNSNFKVTHTFSSGFLLTVSGVPMNLFYSSGSYSDQTYVFLPEDGGVFVGDSYYGVSPFILDIKNFKNLFD